jgi:hypothetical protein
MKNRNHKLSHAVDHVKREIAFLISDYLYRL